MTGSPPLDRSDYVCPFCNMKDFDAIGLKRHYTFGHCDEFNATPLQDDPASEAWAFFNRER
jgi:hypothetical protein